MSLHACKGTSSSLNIFGVEKRKCKCRQDHGCMDSHWEEKLAGRQRRIEDAQFVLHGGQEDGTYKNYTIHTLPLSCMVTSFSLWPVLISLALRTVFVSSSLALARSLYS